VHQQFCRNGAYKQKPQGGLDPGHYRHALLFPITEDAGERIWVNYNPKTATLVIEDSHFHQFGVFADEQPAVQLIPRVQPSLTNWHWSHGLVVILYPQHNLPIANYSVNRSIAALAKPLQLSTWRGPVVIIAVSSGNPSGQYCQVDNIGWADITAAVHYFRTRLSNIGLSFGQGERDVLPALKLTDLGNKFIASAFGELPPMAPVQVRLGNADEWKPCLAAHRLGLNWFIRSANCPSWKDVGHADNGNARWLK
jgi:hypothetical protein